MFDQFVFNLPKSRGMNQEGGTNQNADFNDLDAHRKPTFFSSAEADLEEKHKKKRGTIIVEFFKTEPFERKHEKTF